MRASFLSVIRVVSEQRRQMRERLREAIKAAPLPLPEEIVRALTQLDSRTARDVLRDHPGFSVWEKHRSYEMSHALFERSTDDLFRAIEVFQESSHDKSIFDTIREKGIG